MTARHLKEGTMLDKLTQYRKALAAILVPALIVLGAALVDGVVTWQEWVAIAIAGLGTGAAVAGVPNAITAKQESDIVSNVADPTALAAQLVSEANRRGE